MNEAVERFLDQVKVFDCPEYTKVRVGNPNDGGYVLYKELCEEAPVLYSFGIGDDVGFEYAFADINPTAPMFLFDPFIDSLPDANSRFEFLKEPADVKIFTKIKANSILKMDIEYSEWAILETAALRKFSQMVIEFHIIHIPYRKDLSVYFNALYNRIYEGMNKELFMGYGRVLRRLNFDFYCFHLHVNNSLPEVVLDDSAFPPLLEMSFVRKDLAHKAVPSSQTFPVEGLDARNKLDRPEVYFHRSIDNA
jgi:hypothetical protein